MLRGLAEPDFQWLPIAIVEAMNQLSPRKRILILGRNSEKHKRKAASIGDTQPPKSPSKVSGDCFHSHF